LALPERDRFAIMNDRPMTEAPLLVATTNPGKLREIRAALGGAGIAIVTPADLPAMIEPEETGATFGENACIKARGYAEQSGLPTVAEDSGLTVDALDGRPGVLSARYPGVTYDEKFRGLYAELEGHAQPWTARFVSAVAYVEPRTASPTFVAEGVADGAIATEPRGTHGFGYDPIFIYAPTGKTGGELTDAEKLEISHRGKAFRRFRDWWIRERRNR
jgi:XTP/dITP diphosphohydrolase